MAFGVGFSEVLLILLIALAVFGSTKLPGADNLLRRLRGPDPMRTRSYGSAAARWTFVDWMLLAATIALAGALALSYAPGR
ncbi:MAG TPA: twin-arginine translocase TatA/TatE family subunit [Polyangia bacterium]|nr:twin-arginine translocase TatA/TatE family subunit [Polyangia bacterium]